METMRDVIFYGSKITADGDYSHEIKRCLLLGTPAVTKLDRILQTKQKTSRDIISSIRVCLVKAMVFPVVMHAGEGWNIKKDECRRVDAFEL